MKGIKTKILDEKLALPFMVDPDQLKENCLVVTGVPLIITDGDHELYKPYFGAAGKVMADAGFTFWFPKGVARRLLDAKVARKSNS